MAKIITKDTKPGKGISKNELEKRRFFLFFELIGIKIRKLTELNLLYTIMLIPLLTGLYFSLDLNTDIYAKPIFTIHPDVVSLIILAASVFVTGPATAGFVYVLRNMQRREHAWVASDFFAQFKKNYLQGIAVSALDLICCTVLYVAFNFYVYIMPADVPEMGSLFPIVGAVFTAALAFIYIWAHYYIYTMMVTFSLKFSDLFKNSLMFSLARLPLNIFITAVLAVVIVGFLLLFTVSIIAAAAVFALVLLSLSGFFVVFATYPTIDKFMLQKATKKTRVLNTRS